MAQFFKGIVLPLTWTLCVFYLLSFDPSSVDGLSSIWKVYGIDKPIHFGIFFVLSYLWTLWAVNHRNGKRSQKFILIIVICSAFGMGMEYYQLFFTHRTFSYWDGVADAMGSVVGAWLATKKPLWK